MQISDMIPPPASPSKRRTLTLVFNINDPAAFDRDHPNIKALTLGGYSRHAPYCVTAMSIGNEVARSEMICEALELCRTDGFALSETIGAILQLYEPEEFETFDWCGLKPEYEGWP